MHARKESERRTCDERDVRFRLEFGEEVVVRKFLPILGTDVELLQADLEPTGATSVRRPDDATVTWFLIGDPLGFMDKKSERH